MKRTSLVKELMLHVKIRSMGQSGNILVSGSIYRNIKNKAGIDSKKKNLILSDNDDSVKIYQILPSGSLSNKEKASPFSWNNWSKPLKTKSGQLSLGIAFIVLIGIISIFYLRSAEVTEIMSPNETGIAIIPFRNLTNDHEMEHLGIGFASEVRSKLSLSTQFDFISAIQSTLQYKDSDESPIQIGKKLGVNYLLSGFYQITDDEIKVNVEFVDTATGKGIWDLSFQDDLGNIFKIQSKIGTEILQTFSIVEHVSKEPPTKNIEAYDYYVRAQELEFSSFSLEFSTEQRIELYNKAVELDSFFVKAWYSLVKAKSYRMFTTRQDPKETRKEGFENLKSLLKHMEKYFSDSPYLLLAKASYTYYALNDLDGASTPLKKILADDPQNFEANYLIGNIYKRKLIPEKSLFHLKKAVVMNPAATDLWSDIGNNFMYLADYESAAKSYKIAANRLRLIDMNIIIHGQPIKKNFVNDINGTSPYLISKLWNDREYRSVLEVRDSTNAFWPPKAWIFHLLEMQDSAKHYARIELGERNNFLDRSKALAILGLKDQLDKEYHEDLRIRGSNGMDKALICQSTLF